MRVLTSATCVLSIVFVPASFSGEQFQQTPYGKRVAGFHALNREIFEMQVDRGGILRVADELNRKKPRSESESRQMLPRYDDLTKGREELRRIEDEMYVPVAQVTNSEEAFKLRQKLEIQKRQMEVDFKNNQKANRKTRQKKRQIRGKRKNNAALQQTIKDQKAAKAQYDEAVKRLGAQIGYLRLIEREGFAGGRQDHYLWQLLDRQAKFRLVDKPLRERERLWVEKQVKASRIDSIETRVKLRDQFRANADDQKQLIDEKIDEAETLLGRDADEDLQSLAAVLQQRYTSTALEMAHPRLISLGYQRYKGPSPSVGSLRFTLESGERTYEGLLSAPVEFADQFVPEWAIKHGEKHPYILSQGVLRMWVGEFLLKLSPVNVNAMDAEDRQRMLGALDASFKLDELAEF